MGYSVGSEGEVVERDRGKQKQKERATERQRGTWKDAVYNKPDTKGLPDVVQQLYEENRRNKQTTYYSSICFRDAVQCHLHIECMI